MADLQTGVAKYNTNNTIPKRPNKRTFIKSMVFFRSRRKCYKNDEDIAWLERICNAASTAEEQVPLIIEEIEAESAYYERVVFLCKDFQSALKSFYSERNIKILPFGSAVMDLALKDSDVDLFLDFGGELPQPITEFTKALKNIIYKTKLVRKACAIIANVPIVKCETQCGITCDISFMNRLGVMNSKLIKFLLQIDKRLRPLILILKLLLKKKGLIAKSGVTSFTLIVLTIFFLQQLNLVPSVKELQDLSTNKDFVAGWNTAFSTEIANLRPQKECNYSVVELLVRFFKFYAKFEFAFYVISPFTAKAYLKSTFAELEYTPQEFSCYKENVTNQTYAPFELDKFMCVQDPFNHSRNISRGITQAKVIQFQCICEKSLEICQEELQNNKKTDGKSKFFKKLFTRNMEIDEKRKMFNKRVITIRTDKLINYKYVEPCSEDVLRNNWSRTMTEKVIDVLTKILMCKVNEVPKEKHEEKSMDLKTLNVVAVLQCEFEDFFLISKKRNEVKQTLNLRGIAALRDREELISKRMCERFVKAKDQKPYNCEAVCFVKKGPTSFCISIESQEETGVLKQVDEQFVKFLKFHLPKLVSS